MNLTHIDKLDAIEMSDGFVWRPVRKHFGIRAFGTNVYTPGASRRVVEEHTEGTYQHEEIYLVLRGRVLFTVDGNDHELGQGQLVFLRDPSIKRGAIALTDDAAVLAVGAERRFGLRLSGGVSNDATVISSIGTTTFRRLPFRLGAYLPIRLGPGVLEPGVGLDLEEVWVNVTSTGPAETWRSPSTCVGRVCLSPGADLALGWSLRSSRHAYLRVLAQAGAAISYRFVTPDNTVIWSTPATYLDLELELGVWFP